MKRMPVKEGLFSQEENGRARLSASKCNECGCVFFPKVSVCLNCYQEGLESLALSDKGKLYSYTTVYMPASKFEPPFSIGYIDMPEGVRIFSPLGEKEGIPFQVGMDVELSIEPLWQDEETEVVGYRFYPSVS